MAEAIEKLRIIANARFWQRILWLYDCKIKNEHVLVKQCTPKKLIGWSQKHEAEKQLPYAPSEQVELCYKLCNAVMNVFLFFLFLGDIKWDSIY